MCIVVCYVKMDTTQHKMFSRNKSFNCLKSAIMEKQVNSKNIKTLYV